MLHQVLNVLKNSLCLKIVVAMIVFDTILGLLRAIKDRKLNSNFGINGAIRKIAMLSCVTMLAVLDMLLNVNIVVYVPDEILTAIGIHKIGLCEFFSILFSLFETVSVMKNMVLCELPVPKKIQKKAQQFLDEMTEENPRK